MAVRRTASRPLRSSPAMKAEKVPSARAFDRDVVAGRALTGVRSLGRDRAGNIVPIHLLKRERLLVFVRVTVRVGNDPAAGLTRIQAAIDAVAVRIVGDDEEPLFRARGTCAE